MPDAERKILSTRVLEPAIINEARKGILMDYYPFYDIPLQTHNKYLSAAQIDAGYFIFTSQHAVQAAFDILKDLKNRHIAYQRYI